MDDMSFGYERQKRFAVNDTANLEAYIYEDDDETLVPLTAIQDALFTVRDPSGADTIVNNTSGTIADDGYATYLVPSAVLATPGEYRAICQFVLNDGRKKTVPCDFDVYDPFEDTMLSHAELAIDQAWNKLEDCFDSDLGGPWLRDMTLARFDKSRMRALLPDALVDINLQQPMTEFTEADYPYDDGSAVAVMAQCILVATIRHLIRSYTEQPEVTGSPVAYLDRVRYAQAWKFTLDIEEERAKKWLALWKRQFFEFGHGKLIVATKAGRLIPAPLRSRYPGRGYW